MRPLRSGRRPGLDGHCLRQRIVVAMPSSPTAPLHFDGFASPKFTQVPEELFDLLLPRLSDCELRVLLYIVRRTFGFKREADTIALSQMVHGITTREGQVLDFGTGLSKATAARGLKGLRDKGVISAERRSSAERGHEPTVYRLRFRDASGPSSQPRDKVDSRPLVSRTRQALSQPRDTQQTGSRNTDFEYSKGNDFGNASEIGEWGKPDQTVSIPVPNGSPPEEAGTLGTILQHRVRRDIRRDDRMAISAVVDRFAGELGDQADIKVSVSRALNLFQASDIDRSAFVDLLFRAEGETQDRHRYPGKAPLPRNQMAYFFSLVEDRLNLAEKTNRAERGSLRRRKSAT